MQSRSSTICFIHWVHQCGVTALLNRSQEEFSMISATSSLYMLDVKVVMGKSTRLAALLCWLCATDRRKQSAARKFPHGQAPACFLHAALRKAATAREAEQLNSWAVKRIFPSSPCLPKPHITHPHQCTATWQSRAVHLQHHFVVLLWLEWDFCPILL